MDFKRITNHDPTSDQKTFSRYLALTISVVDEVLICSLSGLENCYCSVTACTLISLLSGFKSPVRLPLEFYSSGLLLSQIDWLLFLVTQASINSKILILVTQRLKKCMLFSSELSLLICGLRLPLSRVFTSLLPCKENIPSLYLIFARVVLFPNMGLNPP